MPRISVLMPTYDHAAFVWRAIESLLAQTLADWELLIVDDGSPDDTRAAVACYLNDPRVRYRRLRHNVGLGAALNRALDLARAPLVAYLPSDDVYYPEHLAELAACLERRPDAILAFSGARHHYNKSAAGQIEGYPLQLVQVMHRCEAGDRGPGTGDRGQGTGDRGQGSVSRLESQAPSPKPQAPSPKPQAPNPKPHAPSPKSQVPSPKSQAPSPKPQAQAPRACKRGVN